MGLTKSQNIAFQTYRSGANIFLFGDAGTGKSYLVDKIIADAIGKGMNVLPVAPTGKAAKNINGGTTIHSTFRVTFGVISPDTIFLGKQDQKGNRYLDMADLIVIDEISMVRYDLFGAVMRSIKEAEKRSNRKKQVIVVGDFCQLPPVLSEDKDGDAYHQLYGEYVFAFEHEDFLFTNIRLEEKIRAKDDEFASMLDHLRLGDSTVLERFKVTKPSKTAITLCSTNKEADTINNKMISKLKNRKTFTAQIEGEVTEDDKFSPERLDIATGAHILFTVNDSANPKRWMNGTDGIVQDYDNDSVTVQICGMPVTVERITQAITKTELYTGKDADGKERLKTRQVEVGKYTQFPFKLGWAITIHKSQGMTLNEVNIDPSRCFAHGQLYVAISRCTSMKGIHMLTKPLPEHLVCLPVVKDFMASLGVNLTENIEKDTETYSAKNNTGEILENNTDACYNGNTFLTIAEAEQVISDYARQIMSKNHIEGKIIVHIVTEDTVAKSGQKKEAKIQRQEILAKWMKQIDIPEVRKRLAAQDDNTRSVYHCITDNLKDGICSLTAEGINKIVGISKRSVETGLQKLRNAGLIESVGARKTPKIHVAEVADTKGYETCLLYTAMAKSRKNKLICQECSHLDCPAHR